MKKWIIGTAAGAASFLLMFGGVVETVTTTPASELPPEIQAVFGYLQPQPDVGSIEGLTWMVPVRYTAITSPFGYRINPIYGYFQLHAGIDLAAPTDTPIYAARDGQVIAAGYTNSMGNYVRIDHGDSFQTVYMHMDYAITQAGASVIQGQIIGYVGSTGDATGPHLHYGVYYEGTAIDPAPYIGLTPDPEETTPEAAP